WRLACLANNVFQALALTMRYKPQLGLSAQPQRRVNRAQRFLLLGHPMQSIERNYEVELFAKRHAPRIRDFEPQVRLSARAPLGFSEADHLLRRVDANDRSLRNASCDLRGDLAVPAANIQHMLGTA